MTMEPAPPTSFRLNDRVVDLSFGTVTYGNRTPVMLRSQALAVLKFLAAKPGTLASKDELMAAIWPGLAVTDDSLVQCITEIRKALGDEDHVVIRTLPKRGYVLEATAYLEIQSKAAAVERPTVALPDKPSIAVLPFTNMSGDPEQQYFSDGITEDIITELSRFRSLLVIARNSSFQYRDKAIDVRRIGAELGARYVVEGSVRRMEGRVRITAQLIDAVQGTHLWSEHFDRNLEELFDIQDEITRTIVSTATGRIEDAEIRSAVSRRTSSPSAYDYVLRGITQFRSFGTDETQLGRELFERAVSLDPNYALAQGFLAMALLAENDFWSAPAVVKERALDLALTAVRLDPRESRCHLFLGQAYRYVGKFDLAVSQMEQGINLNPSDANGLAQFGGLLAVVGRAAEGIDFVKRAMRLNPYHPEWYWSSLTISLFLTHRYEEALEANAKVGRHKKAWALARDAACLMQLGRLDEAHAVAAEILRLKPAFRLSTDMPTFKYEEDTRHMRDALLKAGLPE